MQALVVPQAGQTQLTQLKWIERPIPTPRAGEVLVRTRAVGLNPVDYKVVEDGVAAWQYPHTLGLDVAGTVMAVGPGVTQFTVGQRVCGHGNLAVDGAFAETVVATASALTPIPATVSFERAAGSLCAGLTAYQAIFRKANLNAVRTVLVHAGAGGVGSMAIQLAQVAGKRVFATVSAAKRAFVSRLHPAAVLDYKAVDVTQAIQALTVNQGVDLVVNTIGHPEADLPRLAYNGQLVCVLETPKQVPAGQALTVSNLDLGGAHRSGNPAQVADLGEMAHELLALVAAGQVDPLVTRVIDAAEIVAGLQAIRDHRVMGKIVAKFK